MIGAMSGIPKWIGGAVALIGLAAWFATAWQIGLVQCFITYLAGPGVNLALFWDMGSVVLNGGWMSVLWLASSMVMALGMHIIVEH